MEKVIRLRSSAILLLDENDSVIYSTDFDIELGVITDEFRFKPSNVRNSDTNYIVGQGYTPEMMVGIAELIKAKAGIGEKRDVPKEFMDDVEGEICQHCNGLGHLAGGASCTKCHGSGKVKK